MAKEYIERNELLKWAREFYPEEKVFASKVFASAVINAPTADVQEVVRCKDCIWWESRTVNKKGFVICKTKYKSIYYYFTCFYHYVFRWQF